MGQVTSQTVTSTWIDLQLCNNTPWGMTKVSESTYQMGAWSLPSSIPVKTCMPMTTVKWLESVGNFPGSLQGWTDAADTKYSLNGGPGGTFTLQARSNQVTSDKLETHYIQVRFPSLASIHPSYP